MNHAFLAFGKFSSAEAWIGVLNRIDRLKPVKIVPSHGS